MGRSELMYVPQNSVTVAGGSLAASATRAASTAAMAASVATFDANCCDHGQLARWCAGGNTGTCRSQRCAESGHAHMPRIDTWPASGGGLQVVISNRHEMGDDHRILRHALLDGDMQLLAEHWFDPQRDTCAVSHFHLPGYRGQLHALSACSRDGVWISSVDI